MGIDKRWGGLILIRFGAINMITPLKDVLNMKFSLVILFSLVLVFSAFSSVDSQVDSLETKIKLETWVDRPELPFNEELTLSVSASWDGEQGRFRITPIAPPECENFEILGSSSVNETKMVEGEAKSTKTFEFILKPTQTGTGRIGSVLFSYVDNVTEDSSSLSTQPISVKINPPIEEKHPDYKIFLIIAIVLIFIYVIYSAKRKTKRIKIPEQTKEKVKIPEKTLEEMTLETLDGLSQLISEGKGDEFSSKVYRLMTSYLEEKYHIFTTGKTTNDIIDSLSPLSLPEEQIILIRDTLSACDLVKFAREGAEKERCDQIFDEVKKFLEQNTK
jgi:hypothetical protein